MSAPRTKFFAKVFLAASLFVAVTSSHAQITIVAGAPGTNEVGINQSYEQDFNSLSRAAPGTTLTWTDNSTLRAWYAANGAAGTTTPFVSYRTAATGSTALLATLFSVAQHFNTVDNNTSTTTWRALGGVPNSTAEPVTMALRLRNSTGGTLTGLRVSWEAKWGYTGSIATPTTGRNALTLRWRKFNAGTGTLATSPNGWTTVSSVNIDNNDTSIPDDWNHFNERITGLNVADGQEIWLEWEIDRVSGSATILAIDNVRVSDFAGASPRITKQPFTQSVKQPNGTFFQVEATGSGALAYQWRKNGTDIAGATNATYTLASTSTGLNGSKYSCLVSNAGGVALSEPARLSVYTALDARGPALPSGYPHSTNGFIVSGALSDVVFLPAGRSEKADIYLPDPLPANCPAVVIVHGGGGNNGDKHDDREVQAGIELAKRGYVAMSINYKKSVGSGVSWPRNVQDTFHAVRWLRANAATYNIDTNNIGAIGFSWGCNMVAMLSVIRTNDTFNGERLDGVVVGDSTTLPGYPSTVKAVCAFYGATDPGNYHQMNMHGSTTTADDDPARYFAAAPVNYAHSNAFPTYLSHGTSDTEVLMTQIFTMRDRLRDVGARVEMNLVPYGLHSYPLDDDGSHIDSSAPPGTSIDERGNALGFFDKYLRNTPCVVTSVGLASNTVPVNLPVAASVTTTDVDGDTITYTWAKVAGPGGVTFSTNGVAGASNATVAFNAAGNYLLSVTAFDGNVGTTVYLSATATSGTNDPPIIAAQPQSQTVPAGGNANFDVTVGGTAPFAFQWSKGSNTVAGATNSTFTLSNVTVGDAGAFSVVVTNAFGAATSAVANLTVSTVVTTNVTATAWATVRSGTNYNLDINEAALGYLNVKFSSNIISASSAGAAKSYVQFDLTGQRPDTELPVTVRTIRVATGGGQLVRMWALNQATTNFGTNLIWAGGFTNSAPAHDTNSNEMFTGGPLNATLIVSNAYAGANTNTTYDFTIPAPWDQFVQSNRLTIAFTSFENVPGDPTNSAAGFRITLAPGSQPSLLFTVLPSNTPPSLATNLNYTINPGFTLTLTNTATDAEAPPQTLTFSLLTAPTNATLGSNSGVLTWRPLVAQANSTNPFAVVVTDNGTPNLSATQQFSVTVNPLVAPGVAQVSVTNGGLNLQITGDPGPDYTVQVSSNLAGWTNLFTTNSPPVPFFWVTPDLNTFTSRFYRVLIGP